MAAGGTLLLNLSAAQPVPRRVGAAGGPAPDSLRSAGTWGAAAVRRGCPRPDGSGRGGTRGLAGGAGEPWSAGRGCRV